MAETNRSLTNYQYGAEVSFQSPILRDPLYGIVIAVFGGDLHANVAPETATDYKRQRVIIALENKAGNVSVTNPNYLDFDLRPKPTNV